MFDFAFTMKEQYLPQFEFKDGKQKRRERRAKERKQKK